MPLPSPAFATSALGHALHALWRPCVCALASTALWASCIAPVLAKSPVKPLDLNVQDLNPYAIRLSWQAADALADGFELRECREGDPRPCQRVALMDSEQYQFDYTHAAPGEARRYELRAFNVEGVSEPAHAEWIAERDREFERLHAAWRLRQPQRDAEAEAMAARSSAVLELASHVSSLPSEPWRLYAPNADLPVQLQPDPGAGALWQPIESTVWAERCTSRDELVALPWETFNFRLEWQGRVRLEQGDEVDVFIITDHDTQCDFGACRGWVAFGALPGTECYAHRGWAAPVPPDSEPVLVTGWERGTRGEKAYVWCSQRGRVHMFSTCHLPDGALQSLQPPLLDLRGRRLDACQSWPLARDRQDF